MSAPLQGTSPNARSLEKSSAWTGSSYSSGKTPTWIACESPNALELCESAAPHEPQKMRETVLPEAAVDCDVEV
jgi:hypothetical protein